MSIPLLPVRGLILTNHKIFYFLSLLFPFIPILTDQGAIIDLVSQGVGSGICPSLRAVTILFLPQFLGNNGSTLMVWHNLVKARRLFQPPNRCFQPFVFSWREGQSIFKLKAIYHRWKYLSSFILPPMEINIFN